MNKIHRCCHFTSHDDLTCPNLVSGAPLRLPIWIDRQALSLPSVRGERGQENEQHLYSYSSYYNIIYIYITFHVKRWPHHQLSKTTSTMQCYFACKLVYVPVFW